MISLSTGRPTGHLGLSGSSTFSSPLTSFCAPDCLGRPSCATPAFGHKTTSPTESVIHPSEHILLSFKFVFASAPTVTSFILARSLSADPVVCSRAFALFRTPLLTQCLYIPWFLISLMFSSVSWGSLSLPFSEHTLGQDAYARENLLSLASVAERRILAGWSSASYRSAVLFLRLAHLTVPTVTIEPPPCSSNLPQTLCLSADGLAHGSETAETLKGISLVSHHQNQTGLLLFCSW